MTTLAIYNRWRGQTFSDILGQEHITATLQHQIRANRVGHAYLFTGVRGTGKTSTARIMAKAVNCIGETDDRPCGVCPLCVSIGQGRSVDLIEIDAASNRGIDEIRELRDRVAFAPSEARFKVYVIDEVHMLTNEAFNALLKTLEEPPAHVIFILCTTDPQKLPATVLSRCQRFDFRRGSLAAITDKLSRICQQEGIRITPEALEYVARRATGSFRDAESLLDQLAAYGADEVTLERVQAVLGSAGSSLVLSVVESIVRRDLSAGLQAISEAVNRGAEPRQFLGEILDQLRGLMLIQAGSEAGLDGLSTEELGALRALAQEGAFPLPRLVRTIKLFTEVSNGLRLSLRPELPFELALIEAVADEGAAPARTAEATPATRPERAAAAGPTAGPRPAPAAAPVEPVAEAPRASEPVAEPPQPEPILAPTVTAEPVARVVADAPPEPVEQPATAEPTGAAGALTLEWVQGNWQQALMRIRPRDRSLGALLNSAAPTAVRGNTITLAVEAAFHRDKLMDDSKREMLEATLTEVLGQRCVVEFVVDRDGWIAARTGAQAPRGAAPRDLFQPTDERDALRQQLLNHPAVKELERRGGRVSKVSLAGEDELEDNNG